jgi:hypothetical protein
MYDSPLHFCPVCRQYVALDQSQSECAREQNCLSPCPLTNFFSVPNPVAQPEHADEKSAGATQIKPPTPVL